MFDPFELLRVLCDHHVDFIIVGGVCATLHGAPVATLDLDIVHARTPSNIARLLDALTDLEAIHRHQMGRRIAPSRSHLEGPGHQLLTTRSGDLDVLGSIGDALSYDALLPRSLEITIRGMRVRVLELDALIEAKVYAGRPKDLAVLPVLRHTLAEKTRSLDDT